MPGSLPDHVGGLLNTEQNSLNVELTGRKLKVGFFQQSYPAQVNADADAIVTITPTAGYIGRIRHLTYSAPSVATATGNHYIRAYLGNTTPGANTCCVAYASVAGTSALALSNSATIKDIPFDASNPLTLKYTAPSTSPQTGTRVLVAIWEEEKVAP